MTLACRLAHVMWKSRFSLWITGPTILVSLLLLGLCSLAAVVLYNQQANTAAILDENVTSTEVAHDLNNTLADLVELLPNGQDQVGPLHKRIRAQLQLARDLADKPEERKYVGELESSLSHYFRLWDRRDYQSPEDKATTVAECKRILEGVAVPRCRDLQAFNALQIHQSKFVHRTMVNWVIAGLLSVGVV